MRNLFDRGESLSAFLTRWYGEPDRDRRTGELDPAVPDELATWHRDAAGWEQGIAFQGYPLPPEELRRRPDGKMDFWIENQGGYEWSA
ncbi:hypothetical protein M1L60_45130 [Actinoplanes sp. TRM 88003]|uniref:Uncharacterized protein n=1 Tax=Paractinoplanes aksuensis TaxID=2939490 RepID=A0ABT1E3Q8_9ACTN|nr:hypothetical protein [Actinoplanes aksuensis]MCO8277779.1 hypothetical protein [Actinoplanes aksuensis]